MNLIPFSYGFSIEPEINIYIRAPKDIGTLKRKIFIHLKKKFFKPKVRFSLEDYMKQLTNAAKRTNEIHGENILKYGFSEINRKNQRLLNQFRQIST